MNNSCVSRARIYILYLFETKLFQFYAILRNFLGGFDLQNYEELIFPSFTLNIVEKIKKIKYANNDIFNLWENDKQVQDDDESSSEWEVIPQGF